MNTKENGSFNNSGKGKNCFSVLDSFGFLNITNNKLDCPFPDHEDEHCSFEISPDGKNFSCTCGKRGNANILEKTLLKERCSSRALLKEIKRTDQSDGYKNSELIKTYNYIDKSNKLQVQLQLYNSGDLVYRRPDPIKNDEWIYNTDIKEKPLYRAEKFFSNEHNQIVYMVENEKTADAIEYLGFLATTCIRGFANWESYYKKSFTNMILVIVPDNNETSKKNASLITNDFFVDFTIKRMELDKLSSTYENGDPLIIGVANINRMKELKKALEEPINCSIKTLQLNFLKGEKNVFDWLENRKLNGFTKELIEAELMSETEKSHFIEPEKLAEQAKEWDTPVSLALEESEENFQWEVLPKPLKEIGRAISETMSISPDMVGPALLGITSASLGNKFKLMIKHDHYQYANLFILLVAPPAAKKTPLLKILLEPLIEHQMKLSLDYKNEMNSHIKKENVLKALKDKNASIDLDNENLEKTLREILKKEFDSTQSTFSKAEKPEPKSILCNDATGEAIARRMAANGGSLAIITGEGRKIIDIALGRYSKSVDIDIYLCGHGNDYIRIDRTGKPPIEVADACLSVLIATQPDHAASVAKKPELRESGFLARFMITNSSTSEAKYPRESIPENVKKNYSALISNILNYNIAEGKNHLVTLSEAAFNRWIEYFYYLQEEENLESQLIQQFLGKLPEHVARMALIIHVCNALSNNEKPGAVSEIEMLKAMLLGNYFKAQTKRAFCIMTEDNILSQAKSIINWCKPNIDKIKSLRAKEGCGEILAIKPSDLLRNRILTGIHTNKAAEQVLTRLVDYNWLKKISMNPNNSRKPHILYMMNPIVFGK